MLKNKVSLKNPKDQNFESYQSKVSSLLEKAAQKLFKDKAFHEEFKTVFAFSSILKYLSNLVSFITGFVAIKIAASWLFGVYLSSFIAFVFCLCLEAVKAFFWRINSKWILKYKRFSYPIFGALIFLHFLSLSFSVYGGYMFPSYIKKASNSSSVAPLDLDKVGYLYDQKITKIDSLLALNASKVAITTSNSTVKSLNKVSTSLLSQKDYQEKAKNKAIERAISQNKRNSEERRETSEKRQIMDNERLFFARLSCLVASVLFELLFIACSIFGVYYLFRLNVELEANATLVNEPSLLLSTQQDKSLDKEPVMLSTQQGEPAPRIDFKPSSQIGFKSSSQIGFKSNAKKCLLKSCGKSFVSPVHNKKYCSDECRKMAYQERRYLKSKKTR